MDVDKLRPSFDAIPGRWAAARNALACVLMY
jgi:hypothetical protein